MQAERAAWAADMDEPGFEEEDFGEPAPPSPPRGAASPAPEAARPSSPSGAARAPARAPAVEAPPAAPAPARSIAEADAGDVGGAEDGAAAPTRRSAAADREAEAKLHRERQAKLLMKRPPREGRSFAITTSDGRRVFVASKTDEERQLAEASERTAAGIPESKPHTASSLLEEPVSAMLARIEAAQVAQAVADADAAEARMAAAAERGEIVEGLGGDAEMKDDDGDGVEGGGAEPAGTWGGSSKRKPALRDITGDALSHAPAPATGDSKLWVDKYAPTSFMQLLSSEQLNREVLRWIKRWDVAVFGGAHRGGASGESKSAGTDQKRGFFVTRGGKKDANQGGRASGGAGGDAGGHHDGEQQRKKWVQGRVWNEDARVLLLCGPPGLGKTTLAHIAAKHAGYNTIEINASDDRSATNIKERLHSAMTMRAMFGDNKPNAIVLDEIDGAVGGQDNAVQALVEMVKATPAMRDIEERGREAFRAAAALDGDAKVAAKKKVAAKPIMRPIICICNDVYAPALRPLREVAQVVEFKLMSSTRLVQRLRTICRSEKISAMPSALALLAANTENDIRSCLNSLQFLKSKVRASGGPIRITDDMVAQATVGHKDKHHGLFEVWQGIFMTKRKQRRSVARHAKNGPSNEQQLYDMVQSTGEYDKLLSGLFENYTVVQNTDPMMEKIVACHDWLSFGADCTGRAMGKQQYSMLRYVPTAALGVHDTVHGDLRPKLAYPRAGGLAKRLMKERTHILQTFLQGKARVHSRQRRLAALRATSARGGARVVEVTPAPQDTLLTKVAALDTLSPLLTIIYRPLRPAAFGLMNTREKADVESLVELLVSCDLNFKRHETSSGGKSWESEVQWRLEPELEMLSGFNEAAQFLPGHKPGPKSPWAAPDAAGSVEAMVAESGLPPRRQQLADVVKELINREVNLTKLRITAGVDDAENGSDVDGDGDEFDDAGAAGSGAAVKRKRVALPDHVLAQITPQAKKGATSPPNAPLPSAVAALVGAAKVVEPSPETARLLARTTFLGNMRDSKRKGATERQRRRSAAHRAVYKFQEGFTNAVRRPVLMDDLL